MAVRRALTPRRRPPIPVVSVGNRQVGGSGKTPVTIALASHLPGCAIVSRGYGRQSRGLQVVSRRGEIVASVETAGDEAYLMATKLPEASVIVSEDRMAGIAKAAEMGARCVLLDDGFNRVEIEKFEILLEPARIPNPLPLPAGPFREFAWAERSADLVLKEGRDFHRIVTCEGCDEPMMLLTAVANPERLRPYYPKALVRCRHLLPDHAWFDLDDIRARMARCGVKKLLVTEKDAVKLPEGRHPPLALLRLEIAITPEVVRRIENYCKGNP
jgi:tetraacyldisaccharide 4'-kinase